MAMLKFLLVIMATLAVVVAANGAKPDGSSPVESPGAGVSCSSLIYNMVDCISFFSAGSNETKPSPLCCLGFEVVLDTDAECICEGIKSSINLGMEIDMAKAATLPSACGISAPSISKCDVSPTPGPSPANPPSDKPSAAPVNQAPAPSPNSGAYAIAYSSAVLYLSLIMLGSFIF
ncbi:hypothetical protein Vadar_015448 [Vaccinium darrowii]|uniref:Uncharacterized protein n=1 Tax=Vaccinium darrowii TaxID=229202 RepID=A0ACB7Y794_9ERIC|nr:hypothetical protein Vadar_015448 [Vaccinium darrowii]